MCHIFKENFHTIHMAFSFILESVACFTNKSSLLIKMVLKVLYMTIKNKVYSLSGNEFTNDFKNVLDSSSDLSNISLQSSSIVASIISVWSVFLPPCKYP